MVCEYWLSNANVFGESRRFVATKGCFCDKNARTFVSYIYLTRYISLSVFDAVVYFWISTLCCASTFFAGQTLGALPAVLRREPCLYRMPAACVDRQLFGSPPRRGHQHHSREWRRRHLGRYAQHVPQPRGRLCRWLDNRNHGSRWSNSLICDWAGESRLERWSVIIAFVRNTTRIADRLSGLAPKVTISHGYSL